MSVAAARDVAVIVDLARLVAPCVSPSQAPTDRDLRKFSGSSTAVKRDIVRLHDARAEPQSPFHSAERDKKSIQALRGASASGQIVIRDRARADRDNDGLEAVGTSRVGQDRAAPIRACVQQTPWRISFVPKSSITKDVSSPSMSHCSMTSE